MNVYQVLTHAHHMQTVRTQMVGTYVLVRLDIVVMDSIVVSVSISVKD